MKRMDIIVVKILIYVDLDGEYSLYEFDVDFFINGLSFLLLLYVNNFDRMEDQLLEFLEMDLFLLFFCLSFKLRR